MVFSGSMLSVADNSGAKVVRCVKVVGSSVGVEGSILIVSVRKSRVNENSVYKGKIFKAVLVRCRKPLPRKLGARISFLSNSVVLLKKDNSPVGNRVTKTVSLSLRKLGFSKILILAPFCL